MFSSLLTKIFGSSNEREIKRLRKVVATINALEPQFESLTDEELKAKTAEFKSRLGNNETLNDILPEAFEFCCFCF